MNDRFSTLSMVYPGSMTETEVTKFASSGLYPITLDFWVKHGLFLCKYHVSGINTSFVVMCDNAGFSRIAVSLNSEGEYELYRMNEFDTVEHTRIATSKKPSYILKKWETYLNEQGLSSSQWDRPEPDLFRKIYHRMRDDNSALLRPYEYKIGSLSNIPILYKLATGELRKEDVPEECVVMARTELKKGQDHEDTYKKFMSDYKEVTNGKKYLLLPPIALRGGVLLRSGIFFGSVSAELPSMAGNPWMNKEQFAQYVTVLDKIKWYPSLSALPDNYRDQVMAKLTLAKMTRERYESSADYEGDIGTLLPLPHEFRWYKDANMLTFRRGYNNQWGSWLLFDRG